ncbi:MAG TPA: class II fructose-bisphosphate aldolase [Thermoanaerobaculia bacterium]|nr:class II fructose-bisphosphate aldolase [Thermoanaerobaculia bacterium]
MIHGNLHTLRDMLAAAGVNPDGSLRKGSEGARETAIDDLIYTAVFSGDAATRNEARDVIHQLARAMGIIPSTILPLYEAIGRGEAGGFTVPAVNIRALTYDSSRALFRAAIQHDVGAFILEIARSEIGYTEQRPAEYAAAVLAAAIKEGFRGPVFIQGDHFQASAKRWLKQAEREKEKSAIESLIDEAIAAEFYNIDIDTSTLVDLDQPTVDEQQRPNYESCAHFTRYIRQRQPDGIEISIGGEIGEVGKHNTTPEEFRAYVEGYLRLLDAGMKGISKVSIQTGTSHGGVPMPDGSIAQAKIDFGSLRTISDIARREYGMAGAVQHGASTLPEEVFDQFPKSGTAEIHLATGFQNMVYDHPSFPAALREEVAAWCRQNAADERKEGETDEQFLYKTRKKALGPFKKTMWDFPPAVKEPILRDLEAKFALLFDKLAVRGTRDLVERYFPLDEKLARPFLRRDAPKELSEIPEGEGE